MTDKNNLCNVKDCNEAKSAMLYCGMHYMRFKRHGDPLKTSGFFSVNKPGTKEYIEENTKELWMRLPDDPNYKHLKNPCWIWQRKLTKKGYARIRINGCAKLLHVLSFKLFGGETTKDKPFVCHLCDVTSCCNPDHLYAGDASDNMKDRVIRNRYLGNFGESNGSRKRYSKQSELTKLETDV